ncbi:ammonium transporter [Acidithiobacillus ferrianus]|uniref:Ammonium transporter n=2 Tax=Acidithiobacillus ferrianus TaxID=2678518 RepID=A0A845UA74_9PROT|nr:ammonium transporter [Acidithiobacillus ferrianus]NDU41570.1 ammonium transporter [Acidithiobacillus ferrianus]
MYLAHPSYLSPGDTAWQITAATLVGLQSVPGLAILYGGVVKKKWALNSAMMVFYAFSAVLITWMLVGFSIAFGSPVHLGPGILSGLFGWPQPVMSALDSIGQANIPLLNGGMPSFAFPQSALIYFQFVFAAITPILLAGGVLGRMNFKAWMVFVPIWSALVYSVGAFMLWGGGWLAQLGAVDYSGGYVIHVAAGVSGFVAAAVIGPRLYADRADFPPNNLIMAMAGAGLLWLGWNGFNGGDPYFANQDMAAAVINTNLATAAALLTWLFMDMAFLDRASMVGAINGMICGLVAITPAAGFLNGWGALLLGVAAGMIPWITMNKIGPKTWLGKVDDTLGVLHTHAVAGAVGGLLVGILGDPRMVLYYGAGKTPDISVDGLLYGGGFTQLWHQGVALAVIVGYNAIMTYGILKVLGIFIPLRMSDADLEIGDYATHKEDPIPGVMGAPIENLAPNKPAWDGPDAIGAATHYPPAGTD